MKKKTTIYEAAQIEAISGILTESDQFFFRKICRWYSKEFSTPLDQVISGKAMLWGEILLHYYESQMEVLNHNQLFDIAINDYIPEMAELKEEEDEDFAKALIAEQTRSVRKKEAKAARNNEKNTVSSEKIEDSKLPPKLKLNFEDEEV